MTSLSMVGAVAAQPDSSLAWGMSALFAGGLLFLSSARDKKYMILLALGLISISGLPLTPAWQGSQIYAGADAIPLGYKFIWFFTQTVLICGYIRHAVRIIEPMTELERWVQVVYPSGLALLPITFIGVMFIPEHLGGIIVKGWWGSLVVIGLSIIAVISVRRLPTMSKTLMNTLRVGLSLDWAYRIIWWIYRISTRLISGITQILEGEGGVLWAVLILVLLISFLVTSTGGG
jgi:hypothetical protein